MRVKKHLTLALAIIAIDATLSAAGSDLGEIELVGAVPSDAIPEASGLAKSLRRDDRLWIINDSGSPPALHAIGTDASVHGAVTVNGVANVDWEDLASFEVDGEHYLMIGDIGDNGSLRDSLSLHIVPEPDATLPATVDVERTLRFRYPDGPRDAEAIAVDAAEGLVYVLTKRNLPARLYSVPLYGGTPSEPVAARYLGLVDSLPQPTAQERKNAPQLFWYWQPTAMDFSADGSFAQVLTYRGIYTYDRDDDESWFEALSRPPRETLLKDLLSESLCVTASGTYVTVERRRPPLYRLPLPAGEAAR